MSRNYQCIIAYQGTPYFGFKKTKMGPSVEEMLEQCLVQILQHPIRVQGASLTDRGVHADGQVIHFFSDKVKDANKLLASLRALLPATIVPLEIALVDNSFHPSLDAKYKTYHYSLCNSPFQMPQFREFSWHWPYPLDLEKMEKAAQILLGKHDFSAFSNARYEDANRHLMQIRLKPLEENRLEIQVEGDRFLYKMVRNLVGTLVYVGMGKIPLESIQEILEKRDRRLSGVTAPAHGLTLKRVYY